MHIPDSTLDLMRKSAQATDASATPPWRALGMQLADMANRASFPGATDAERRAYHYALAVQGGRVLAELERLLRPTGKGKEPHAQP